MTALYYPAFGTFVGPWRARFAWLPVRLFDGSVVWLKAYKRRRVQLKDYLHGPDFPWWFNALPGDPCEGLS